jgi:hypothetical protein
LADLICTGKSPQPDGTLKDVTPHKTSVPDTWQLGGHNGQYVFTVDFVNGPPEIVCGVCGADMRVVKPSAPAKSSAKA